MPSGSPVASTATVPQKHSPLYVAMAHLALVVAIDAKPRPLRTIRVNPSIFFGQPINLLHLLGRQLPTHRLHVRLNLLRLGRTRDDAADGWTRREPGECKLQHRVAARFHESFELLDEVEV